MKVEVQTAALADAVAWTTKIISARPATPLLAGVKIEASEGILNLSSFDYEVSAQNHIEAGVDEKGTIVVLGKLLADISKQLPSEKTYLSTKDSKLHIESGRSSFTLQLMPEDQYPTLPEIPHKLGSVDGQTFAQAINQVSVAVAHEESRPVLTGVHMVFHGNQVEMTSTDRFRLSRTTMTWSSADEDIETSVLIRGSVLHDISRSVDPAQNVIMGLDPENPKLVSFANAGRISTSQAIDGEFPQLDALFASSYPIQAVLNRQEFTEAIRRVSVVAERNASVRLAFDGTQVQLSAGSLDKSQATETISADLDGDPITLAFNPMYLLDGLSVISEPFVRMKMVTALKAVEFNGQQEQDSDESLDYRYLLVPMRYSD
jgi:DNA polymerase-3 subunit beta